MKIYLVFATRGYVAGSAGYISWPAFQDVYATKKEANQKAKIVNGYVITKTLKV